jgi:hypothetical protein
MLGSSKIGRVDIARQLLACKDGQDRANLMRINRIRRTVVTQVVAQAGDDVPLMVKAARGEAIERPPCW